MINIPSHWKMLKLEDVCSKITDGTHKTPRYQGAGVRFISIKNIRPYQPVNWDSYVKYITKEEHAELTKRCKPEYDDILFPRIGTLGFAKRIDFKEEVSMFVGLGLLKPIKEVVNPKYLEYWMNHPFINKLSREKANGSGRLTLPLEETRIFPIPVAPIREQKRIVAEIEKQFSRLDEAVANLKRIKANFKRYKAAVLNAACTGEIGGVNRQAWASTTLGAVAKEIRNGYSLKPDAEQGTRIFRISAVRPLTLALDDVRYLSGKISDYADFQVVPGDILFTRYNGNPDFVGVCAVVPDRFPPTIHPDKLIRVRVADTILIPQMLAILASAGESRAFLKQRIRTTAGQAGISGADLKSMPVSVPPIDEQHLIVAEVDRLLSTTIEIDTQVTVNLIRAERLRQSILMKAFAEALIDTAQVNSSHVS